MSIFCAARRPPRAGVDPIDTADSAMSVLAAAFHTPARHETLALLLDDERRGHVVFVVAGTTTNDSIHDVADVIAAANQRGDELGAVVLASVRPGGSVEPDDVDRWLELSETLGAHGVELLEWFVVGSTTECPRDLLGEAPRW